jgi:hypothetical protein
MTRRGQDGISPLGVVIGIVIGLVVLGLIIFIFNGRLSAFWKSSSCEGVGGKGGTCMPEDGCDISRVDGSATGCAEGLICCKKSGAGSGAGGGSGSQQAVLPALRSSTLSGRYLAGNRVTEDTILVQANPEPRAYMVNSMIYYHDSQRCTDPARNDPLICDVDWNFRFVLEDANHNLLYSKNFTLGYDSHGDFGMIEDVRTGQSKASPLIRIEPVSNEDTGEITSAGSNTVGWAVDRPSPFPEKNVARPAPSEATITGTTSKPSALSPSSSGTGTSTTTPTASKTTTSKTGQTSSGQSTSIAGVSTGSYAASFIVTVTPNSSLAGQRLHLIAVAYPYMKGYKPELESKYDLYITMQSPITVQGLTAQWSRSKDIKITCTAAAACSAAYFKVSDSQACPAFGALSGSAAIPSAVTKYCLWAGRERGECYDTQDDCDSHLPQSDGKYDAAVQSLMKSWQQNQDVQKFGQMYASLPQSGTPTPVCTPTSINSADCASRLCKIATFDPQSHTGTFTLDQMEMAGKYLCVYGVTAASGKTYAVSPPQQIRVDVTPPAVGVKFDPISLTIKVSCNDGAGNVSGCKDVVGIAYINDISKFPRALVSGPSSAAALCPGVRSSGAYTPMMKRTFSYSDTGVTPDSVRVLCVRGEDNAGNAGVSMVTVYNGYATLAGALAMATQK